MSGYDHNFYFLGDISYRALSNGTNYGYNDKGNDIGVLEQWHALDPGVGESRNMAYFGDYIGSALRGGSAEAHAYLNNTMGVDWRDRDVSDVIGNQTVPVVVPGPIHAASFVTGFIVYGGCPAYHEFDQIGPEPGAGAGHYFTDSSGIPITDVNAGVASVVNPGAFGVDVTFPYSMMSVYDITGRGSVGRSNRTLLFQEILDLFNAGPGTTPPLRLRRCVTPS